MSSRAPHRRSPAAPVARTADPRTGHSPTRPVAADRSTGRHHGNHAWSLSQVFLELGAGRGLSTRRSAGGSVSMSAASHGGGTRLGDTGGTDDEGSGAVSGSLSNDGLLGLVGMWSDVDRTAKSLSSVGARGQPVRLSTPRKLGVVSLASVERSCVVSLAGVERSCVVFLAGVEKLAGWRGVGTVAGSPVQMWRRPLKGQAGAQGVAGAKCVAGVAADAETPDAAALGVRSRGATRLGGPRPRVRTCGAGPVKPEPQPGGAAVIRRPRPLAPAAPPEWPRGRQMPHRTRVPRRRPGGRFRPPPDRACDVRCGAGIPAPPPARP